MLLADYGDQNLVLDVCKMKQWWQNVSMMVLGVFVPLCRSSRIGYGDNVSTTSCQLKKWLSALPTEGIRRSTISGGHFFAR